MANNAFDNRIVKAAAAPAKKLKKRRVGRIFGLCVAVFFIVMLFLLSVNSIIALIVPDYVWTVADPITDKILSFTQTVPGLIAMIVGILLIIAVCVLARYILRIQEKRKTVIAALVKSQEALSKINLRYDNIHEITAVLDVLGMLTEKPKSKKEAAEADARMAAFIKAENIALPQTPETVAILDSLPAPDTPGSLAAALSAGATLRQAEDGQTLILTTISGGKNILLTPVQTADGIILCQQGARIKSDLAPNLEDIGFTSMPASPEFFEGLPLEKNVEYPELPEPKTFGPEMLSGEYVSVPSENTGALSSPTLTSKSDYAALGGGTDIALLNSAEHAETAEIPAPKDKGEEGTKHSESIRSDTYEARAVYKKYRGASAVVELEEVRRLDELLSGATPLSDVEKKKVEEYKASRKRPEKKKKELTPDEQSEKKKKAKLAAQKRKAEHEAFLSALSPEDRELYLAEQKLKKSRQAAIRKLKKIEADRKILRKLDED